MSEHSNQYGGLLNYGAAGEYMAAARYAEEQSYYFYSDSAPAANEDECGEEGSTYDTPSCRKAKWQFYLEFYSNTASATVKPRHPRSVEARPVLSNWSQNKHRCFEAKIELD